MDRQEVLRRIEALTESHGYATHREREQSDALLKAAVEAFEEYAAEFVCSDCGAVAIHRSEI